MPGMTGFSDELDRLMAARPTGVRQLARAAGLSAGYISRLHNGTQLPSDDTAAHLDEILGAHGSLIAATRHEDKPHRPDMGAAWRPAAAPTPSGADRGPTSGVSPVAHLHRLRAVLIEQDNILGPGRVAPVVLEQIGLIEELRRDAAGTDARDLLHLQTMFAEFAAWCAQDAADFPAARYWLDRALELAHMTLDPVWPAYILARKAQLAGDMHDPRSAVGLARAAVATSRKGPATRLPAVAAAYEALGHALAGDGNAAQAAVDTAREAATGTDDDRSVPWLPWLGPEYVAVHEARCRSALGQHDAAAAIYSATIAAIPATLARDRGVYTARMARSLAAAGQWDAASRAGLDAVAAARATRSGRIITELQRLSSVANRNRDRETAALRDALSGLLRRRT